MKDVVVLVLPWKINVKLHSRPEKSAKLSAQLS